MYLLYKRFKKYFAAIRRRLLHPAIGQCRLAEGDGAFERVHQLGREALHAGIGDSGEAVGEQLRRGKQIAQVVIDLRHRKPEAGVPVLLV